MRILFWVVEYFATLVEILFCVLFTKTFLDRESVENMINRQKILIYSSIGSFLVILINKIELFSFLNGISGIILLCIVMFIIYKRKYSVLVLLILIYSVIASTIDFVVVQMGAVVLMTKTNYLIDELNLERCVCVFVSKLILGVLIYLIYRYTQNQSEIPKKYVISMGCMAIILFSLEYYIINKILVAYSDRTRQNLVPFLY